MEFFNSAVDTLQTIVVGLGGALCVWGGINLLEGYGQDNPGSKSQGVKQLVAGGGVALIGVTLSFLNRKVDPVQYAKSFEIAPQGDDFDDIRAEYTAILQKQLASGNNGIVKTKYLTFTIEADSLKTARSRLTRIGLDLLGYFKTMGCVAHVMDGQERLEVLHGIFHPDGEPFRFDWDWLAPSGLSTKDFVAPSSLCFGTAKTFGLGGKYGAVSFLQILAPELSDEMLADFLKTESGILVNLHVQAIDQTEAIKTIKRKITDLDAMKIQEQKKAVRSGYDMDIRATRS